MTTSVLGMTWGAALSEWKELSSLPKYETTDEQWARMTELDAALQARYEARVDAGRCPLCGSHECMDHGL